MEFEQLKRVLTTDNHCIIRNGVLIITNIYTYEKVYINLKSINEDVFSLLSVPEEEIEELL